MTLRKPPQWNEVTAIFGGRFDPPHLGHREAVRGLFLNPGVRQVVIIPSASPPHKPCVASAEHRSEMAKICFQATPFDTFNFPVSIDPREIVRAKANPNIPSYSFDTLQELRPLYSQIAFVIGTDQLAQLSSWHRFPDLLSLSHWIVLERKPLGNPLVQKTLQEWTGSGLIRPVQSQTWQLKNGSTFLKLVPTDAEAISSTHIREAIVKDGNSSDQVLLPEVLRYLKDHRLYGIKEKSYDK